MYVCAGAAYPRIATVAGCSDEDSDSEAEADRRMAMLFNTHDTIDPSKDADILAVKHKISHTRAKSLPPPMVVEVVRDDESPPPPLPPRVLDDDGEGVNEGETGTQEEAKAGREGAEPGKGAESSLDRSPSHMRKFLKKPGVDAVSWVWLSGGGVAMDEGVVTRVVNALQVVFEVSTLRGFFPVCVHSREVTL